MTRISSATSQSNLLSRQELFSQGTTLSRQQMELDAMEANFSREASDVGNLLSMTGAAAAFRLARVGMQSFGLAKVIANPLALGVETTAFRASSNLVSHLRGQNPHENIFDARGWATSFITFGSLKAAGAASQGQSLVLGHTFQASAMVASHNFAYGLGIATQPEGSLMSQFMRAEMTNLALGAGHSVFGVLSGGSVARLERSLDVVSEASAQRNQRAQEQGPSRRPLFSMRSQRIDAIQPLDRPPSIPEAWFRQVTGTRLWSAELVRTNRDSVRAITRGVLQLLGKNNVVAQFGYGSGFDKFDPETSVRQLNPDNKFDLVIVVNSFEAALGHLGSHWGFDSQKTRELITLAKTGGVFCPNPDMLVEGFGLLGFKLTIVSEERFYADTNGKPSLNFAQFRLKDTIIADESNPSNRLLWIQDPQNTSRIQSRIDAIRDHMLDISFHLRGSFAPHRFSRSRYNATEITVGDLTAWMYELSYNVEAYRPFDWGKGPTLFEKRAVEITPFMLEAARRFAVRNTQQVRLVFEGKTISPEQITAENLYQVKLVDRDRQATQSRQTATPAYTQLLIDTNKSNWIGSKTAMASSRFAEAYEFIDNATYGGRKMRKPANEKGFLVRLFLRPLVRILRRIVPDKIDSVNYPVLFTEIATQTNGLYRAKKINDREWEILNRAWMANPMLTRQRNIEILQSFEKNIPQTPLARVAYLKLLEAIAETRFREPTVRRWSRRRIAALQNEPSIAQQR